MRRNGPFCCVRHPRARMRWKTTLKMYPMQITLPIIFNRGTYESLWHFQGRTINACSCQGLKQTFSWVRLWRWLLRLWIRRRARRRNGWYDHDSCQERSPKRLASHSKPNPKTSSSGGIKTGRVQYLLHESVPKDNDSETAMPSSLP